MKNKIFEDFGIHVKKDHGQDKAICPQCSSSRKKANIPCLSVNIDLGTWFCHHCSWSGGLKKSIHKDESMIKRKVFKKPIVVISKTLNNELPGKIVEWFIQRKIPLSVLSRNKIGVEKIWMPGVDKEVNTITFPYFKNSEVVNIKYRDGSKNFRQVKDASKIFYGLDDIETETIVVEGEMDKLALEVAGFRNCISVPDGAPSPNVKAYETKFSYLESCEDELKVIKKFILATDDDAPGRKLKEELIRRIGAEKCWQVDWPLGCKDSNDVLIKKGEWVLRGCIEDAYPVYVPGLYEDQDIAKEVDDLYNNGVVKGESTGFFNLDEYYTVRPGECTYVTGIPSHGKALAVDTLIPTPDGWSIMGRLKIGDRVFDENGQSCNIVAVTDIMEDRPCYRLTFDEGTEIVADAEHLWYTISEKERRSASQQKKNRNRKEEIGLEGIDQRYKKTFTSIVTTREIARTLASQGENNYQIPVCKALQYSQSRLVIKPYTFGIWLGDGRINTRSVCCYDKGIRDKIKADGYTLTIQAQKNYHTITEIQPLLRELGVLGNKFIPTQYLHSSEKQRVELLKGLLDTDGSCSGLNGRCEFASIKKRLAEDVLELVLSLGIKATMIYGRTKLDGKDCGPKYRVCFTTNIKVFSLEKKYERQGTVCRVKDSVRTVVKCDYVRSVPVKCIQVDSKSHLYLASESMIPTHNSEFIDALVVNLASNLDWRFAICSPENQPLKLHFAKFAAKYIGKPFYDGPTERMDKEDLVASHRWMSNHITFILPDENEMSVKGILDKAKVAVERHGIRGLVIDPWNELDHSRPSSLTETEYISQCLSKIRVFARLNGVHVWVIAHPTKLQKLQDGSYPVPTLYDIAGAAHWRNKADNGLSIWRDTLDESNDVKIYIQKIRFKEVGKQGCVDFKYDIPTGRYSPKY